MRVAKQLFLTVLAVALATYAFDCEAMTSPEQAMQCCKSMHCSAHHRHGVGQQEMDCCKTMTSMHAPFVQPSSLQGLSYSPIVFAAIPASGESRGLDSSSSSRLGARCHAPPIFDAPAPPTLRISPALQSLSCLMTWRATD